MIHAILVPILSVLAGLMLVLGLDRSLEAEPTYTVLMTWGYVMIAQGIILPIVFLLCAKKKDT
jgi:hypothetical protein